VPVPATPSTVLGGTVYPAPSEPEPEPAPAVIELEGAPVISLVDDESEPLSGERADTSFFAVPPPAREHDTSTLADDGIEPTVSMFASPPPAREPEATPEVPESAFASPPPARDDDIISIVEEDDDRVEPASEAPTAAGMWCRDDDQWIGGVEIADFISDNGTIRYWLRRTSDGQMLPRPFDATDLRFIRETAPSGSES